MGEMLDKDNHRHIQYKMFAILEVMGDENASNQHKASAIDRIATQYVAARWHIQKEGGK